MENLIEAEDIAIKDYITNIKNKILTTEQLIDMQISTKINLKDSCMTDLKYYLYLENTLLEDIDKSENLNITQKKLLRKQVYYLLKENFTHNERRETIRNNFISQIDLYLYSSIIPNLDFSEQMLAFSTQKEKHEKNQNIINSKEQEEYKNEIKQFIKQITQNEITNSNNRLLTKMNIYDAKSLNKLPKFLTRELSKIIKQKIFLQWRMNYEIPMKKLQLDNDPDYSFLYKQYRDFYDDKVNLFDMKYFNNDKSILILLFKCLYYSNKEYLSYECNVKIFVNNTKKYLNLMNVDNNNIKHSSLISDCLDNKENIDKVFEQLVAKINNNEETLKVIVFNMSAMLNGITEYIDIGEGVMKPAFTPQLKCSAKQKVFLINFLKTLDQYTKSQNNKCLHLNVLMENYVFASLVKSYTKVLYDEVNKMKIDLTYGRIFILLERLNKQKNRNDNIDTDDEDDTTIPGSEISTLDDIECRNLYALYSAFKDNCIEISKNKDTHEKGKKKVINKIKSGISSFFTKANQKAKELLNQDEAKITKIKVKYLNQTILSPIDPINSSTQVCICINGFFMNEDFSTYSTLSSNTFNNILTNTNKISLDYYIYTWQNKDNLYKESLSFMQMFDYIPDYKKEIKHNKAMATLYGKLLAYILSSREVFKFHTVSLIGIGLGCKVIKECLKEMLKIYCENDISDLIQNVIFIGGACSLSVKHVDLLRIISERFVNVYNEKDNYLKYYYKNKAIGNKQLVIVENTKNEYLPIIENYDITKDIKRNNYLLELNNILNKLDFN